MKSVWVGFYRYEGKKKWEIKAVFSSYRKARKWMDLEPNPNDLPRVVGMKIARYTRAKGEK